MAGGHWEGWMCWQGLDTWDTSWINDLCIMGNLKPAVTNTECCNSWWKHYGPGSICILICIKRPLWWMAGQPQVRTQNTKREYQTFTQQCQYLFKLRVSHHALQGVDDRVPLHGRQDLPCDFAGIVIQTLHFRGWRVEEESAGVMKSTLKVGEICKTSATGYQI